MPTATDIANELNANYMQRLQKMHSHNRLTHIHSVDINKIREYCNVDIQEAVGTFGPQLWHEIHRKMKQDNPYLAEVIKSFLTLLQLNEISSDGWQNAHIAGHSLTPPIFKFTKADAITLKHWGFNNI